MQKNLTDKINESVPLHWNIEDCSVNSSRKKIEKSKVRMNANEFKVYDLQSLNLQFNAIVWILAPRVES